MLWYACLWLSFTFRFSFFFFFKQKTAYEMRISDWSSDVCSSDLPQLLRRRRRQIFHLEPPGTPYVAGRRFERALSLHRDLESCLDGLRMEIGRASCRERVCQYV